MKIQGNSSARVPLELARKKGSFTGPSSPREDKEVVQMSSSPVEVELKGSLSEQNGTNGVTEGSGVEAVRGRALGGDDGGKF